ncbi:MAG: helix-turn-helix transcriptional regulator [Algicola sp.]|nr:helix-turn-helix transcriptional regulator [Algicola sp.]
MNQTKLLALRKDIEQTNKVMVRLVDELAQVQQNPLEQTPLDDFAQLAVLMKDKRQQTGITIEDLALQTDISQSTLKRLFADPASARFSNVIQVLKELGLKAWLEQ